MSDFQCPFCKIRSGHSRQCQFSINWEPKAQREGELRDKQSEQLKNTQIVASWSNDGATENE